MNFFNYLILIICILLSLIILYKIFGIFLDKKKDKCKVVSRNLFNNLIKIKNLILIVSTFIILPFVIYLNSKGIIGLWLVIFSAIASIIYFFIYTYLSSNTKYVYKGLNTNELLSEGASFLFNVLKGIFAIILIIVLVQLTNAILNYKTVEKKIEKYTPHFQVKKNQTSQIKKINKGSNETTRQDDKAIVEGTNNIVLAVDTTEKKDNFGDKGYNKEYMNLGEVLSAVNNLLQYFAIFVITITLVVSLIGIPVFRAWRDMKGTIEKAETAVLESALSTIVTVPMTLPTQITSEAYYPAIREISRVVRENRKIIGKKSKYAPLYIIESLDYWINDDLFSSVSALENAWENCTDTAWRQKIAFLLGRSCRQMAYDHKSLQYLDKSLKWSHHMNDEWENVFRLTISFLRKKYFNGTSDQIKEEILNCFREKIIQNYGDFKNLNSHRNQWEMLKEYIKNSDDENIASDNAKFLALSLLAITEDKDLDLGNLKQKCAGDALMIYESLYSEMTGININAIWYYSMSKLAKIARGEKNEDWKKYRSLSLIFADKCEKAGIKKLNIMELCVNVHLDEFRGRLIAI